MRKPNLYFPIETTVRELDGKLLLASRLAKYYNIILGSRFRLKQLASADTDGVYMVKSINIQDADFYKVLKAKRFKIILLHSEGGVLTKDTSEFVKYSYPDELSVYIDKLFIYGSQIKSDILKFTTLYPESKLVVTGEPRFDLNKNKFNDFYHTEKELGNLKPFVLINTSFGLSNHKEGDEWVDNYIANNQDFSEILRSILAEKKVKFKKYVTDFVSLVQHLATRFPSLNFVVRPHPEENNNTYIQAFKDIPNVRVIHKWGVGLWILNSVCVIHHDCTTGIEARINGKPVISYGLEHDDRLDAWLPIAVSMNLENQNHVEEALSEIIKGDYNDRLREEHLLLLSSFIHNAVDGVESHDLIYQELLEWSNKVESEVDKQFVKTITRFKAIDIYTSIKKPTQTIPVQKLGVLKVKDIEKRINSLSRIVGQRPLHVSQYAQNVIRIEEKS